MLLTLKSQLATSYLASIGLWFAIGTQQTFGFDSNDQAIISAAWTLAGAGLGWLGLSLAFWSREPGPGSRLERFTFPGSQAIARGVLLATMATTAACGTSDAPTLTYVGEATSTSLVFGEHTTSTSATANTQPSPNASSTIADSVPAEVAPPERPATGSEPTETAPDTEANSLHTVANGEHLWSIAIDHLSQGQPGPSTSEVASYWRRLVEENRSRLSSGNPNLIFPGEVLIMPD